MKIKDLLNRTTTINFFITVIIFIAVLFMLIGSFQNALFDVYEYETEKVINSAMESTAELLFNIVITNKLQQISNSNNIINNIEETSFSKDFFIYDYELGFIYGNTEITAYINPELFSSQSTYTINKIYHMNAVAIGEEKKLLFYTLVELPEHDPVFLGYIPFSDPMEFLSENLEKETKQVTLQLFIWVAASLIVCMILFLIFNMKIYKGEVYRNLQTISRFVRKAEDDGSAAIPEFKDNTLNELIGKISLLARNLRSNLDEKNNELNVFAEREIQYITILESLPLKVFLKNSDSVFVYCNSTFAAELGLKPEEVYGKNDFDLYLKENAAQYLREDKEVFLSNKPMDIESKNSRKEKMSWIRLLKIPIMSLKSKKQYLIGIFWDITDRKIAEKEIRELNTYLEKRVIERTEELLKVNKALFSVNKQLEELTLIDPLTNLPNRRCLEKDIQQEWKASLRDKRPISILMLDVDYFKLFNDNYGHQEGDECLKEVADSIKRNVTRPRDCCARYGGEEFIVVLGKTPREGAEKVANAILQDLDGKKILHNYSPISKKVTISIGITTAIPDEILSYEELIEQSDKALYRAKRNGRNRIAIYSG